MKCNAIDNDISINKLRVTLYDEQYFSKIMNLNNETLHDLIAIITINIF